MDVWLNGQFVSADKASLSIFDAGLQHGIGLFETMAAANGSTLRETRSGKAQSLKDREILEFLGEQN